MQPAGPLQPALVARHVHPGGLHVCQCAGQSRGHALDSRNKDLDFGPLDVSRRHTFTVNYIYEIPFFTKRGILAGIFARWQISGIATFQTGLPVNVTQAGDTVNFGGNTGPQRPDEIGNPNSNLGASPDQWFNSTAYVKVTGAGNVGNAQYDSTWGPGIANYDTSLLKTFQPRKKFRVQTGVETFNTFNHTQFESVSARQRELRSRHCRTRPKNPTIKF